MCLCVCASHTVKPQTTCVLKSGVLTTLNPLNYCSECSSGVPGGRRRSVLKCKHLRSLFVYIQSFDCWKAHLPWDVSANSPRDGGLCVSGRKECIQEQRGVLPGRWIVWNFFPLCLHAGHFLTAGRGCRAEANSLLSFVRSIQEGRHSLFWDQSKNRPFSLVLP